MSRGGRGETSIRAEMPESVPVMAARKVRRGLAALCIGGQGVAMVVERV